MNRFEIAVFRDIMACVEMFTCYSRQINYERIRSCKVTGYLVKILHSCRKDLNHVENLMIKLNEFITNNL